MEKNLVFAPASIGRDLRKEGERLAQLSKRKGELAELAFILKAASLGFIVSKPYGDSFPYDLVVETDGRLRRIQVKSSFTSKRCGYSVNLGTKTDARVPRYTADNIDFLAIYIAPHDTWYIIPVCAIRGASSLLIYPVASRRKDAGRFEIYREAWHLISATPDRAAPPPEKPPPPESSSGA